MNCISSDTNIWIDFCTINKTQLPFSNADCSYLIFKDAADQELLHPPGLKEALLNSGLVTVDFSEDEFNLVQLFIEQYRKLSFYDCAALAIAKCRKTTLLTGDKALRQAAKKEGVNMIGSIGLCDILLQGPYITREEYCDCLSSWLHEIQNDNRLIRLPKKELIDRLYAFGGLLQDSGDYEMIHPLNLF